MYAKFLIFSTIVGCSVQLHAETVLLETFESPDVSATSTVQNGAKYNKGQLPNNGKWIGSTLGSGSSSKGLINKAFCDFTSPSGNNQGIYFGGSNTGITTSVAAITNVLALKTTYTISFDIARDNNKTSSNYRMELVAFASSQGDATRSNVTSTKPGTVLGFSSGKVTSNTLTQRVTFIFEADPSLHASHLGKNLGLRFIGNSTCPILDNVEFSVVEKDSDDDGMDDAWEITHFGDLGHDGTADTDADLLTDAFEFEAKLNPNNSDSNGDGQLDWIGVPGYLSIEEWTGIAGNSLSDLVGNSAFYGPANFRYYVPQSKSVSGLGDDYGIRLRGTVKAPTTGTYRFWVAGDGQCALHLSSDSTPYKRRKIAMVETSTAPDAWDASPPQKSADINLVAGQSYFIEVLMKAGVGSDHVSVAWEYPGRTRIVIPGSQLQSFVPDANDQDGDGMLDTWETQVGLDPVDNGATDLNESAYVDLDEDGLSNSEEYIFNGNPTQSGGNQGHLELDIWNGITGATVKNLTDSSDFAGTADTRTWTGATFQTMGDNYGARLRGTLTPSIPGDYYLYVSGNDAAELWFSQAGDRFSKRKIAWNSSLTNLQQWDLLESQKSQIIQLEANQSYHIEALLKEGTTSDHLSLGWARLLPANVSWTTTDIALDQPSTWTEDGNAADVTTLGGDIWTTSDKFTYRYAAMTGDCVLTARIPSIVANSVSAKAGLMIRGSLAANSQNIAVLRTGDGRIANQSRSTIGNITQSSYRTDPDQADTWLRLVRAGTQVIRYSSEDGESWKRISTGSFSLGSTYYVGLAVAGLDTTVPVEVSFDNISLKNSTPVEVIPASALQSIIPHINDVDDDGLPDDWETQKGLNATTAVNGMGQFGDPDGDGVDNLTEYQYGGNPMVDDGVPGLLTRELWNTHPSGDIRTFVRSSEFLAGPDRIALHPSAEFQKTEEQAKFGQRLRGGLVAPVSGWYRFWISGDKDFELWLSTDSTKFHKRKIASALQWEDGANARSVQFRFWDKYSSQSSKPVYLNQGDTYFLEILHKNVGGSGHFSVAWSYTDEATGQLTNRTVIAPTYLRTHLRAANDSDDDYLPDEWETAKGLNPADNGLTDSREGEYSDYDGDGLTNREEHLLGTNPTESDTDGDGMSDFDEARRYFSNPAAADASPEDVVSVVPVGGVANLGTKWITTDYGVKMKSFRGEGIWNFTVPTAGFWLIRIDTRLLGDLHENETMPVNVKIDGTHLTTGEILYKDGSTGFLRVLTGYLGAGSHELELFFDNYMARRKIEVNGISILKLSGADADQNGMPDLLENHLHTTNKLSDDQMVVSHVSPVFIEGLRRTPESFELRVMQKGESSTARLNDSYWNNNLPTFQAEADAIVAGLINQPGADRTTAGDSKTTHPGPGKGTWFGNLALEMNQVSTYSAFFENGVFAETGVVVWRPLNVTQQSAITIPVGSELLMGAWLSENDNSTLEFTVAGQVLPETYALQTVAHSFDAVGEFLVTVLHESSGNTYELLVRVEGANFPGDISLGESRTRLVKLPQVQPHLTPDSGGDMIIDALRPATEGGSQTYMGGLKPGSHLTAVRMAEHGPILDIEPVAVVGVSDALRNDADRLAGIGDGYYQINSPLLITNLPPGGYAVIKIFRSGVTFLDGTTIKTIRAEDLDEYGFTNVGFYLPSNMNGGYCHYVDVFDANGNRIYFGN